MVRRIQSLWQVASRVATAPTQDLFVLRGGLVVCGLVAPAPRPVDDVDFLLTVDSLDACRQAVEGVFGAVEWQTIWEETEFPGLRGEVPSETGPVQVDIGFGDPMPRPPVPLHTPTGEVLAAVAPEVLFAWKVHGLFERGRGIWRGKDLFDCILMMRAGLVDEVHVPHAVDVSFRSRGTDFGAATARFFADEFGHSRGGHRRWRSFRRRRPDAPESHLPLLAELRTYLTRVLKIESKGEDAL